MGCSCYRVATSKMNIRPLILDAETQGRIKAVKDYTTAHPVSTIQLYRTRANPSLCVGDNPAHVCLVANGYRVVFSLEQQPKLGLCRHISVSVHPREEPPMYPSVPAVQLLCQVFGFEGDITKTAHMVLDGDSNSVNIIQPVAVPVPAEDGDSPAT